MEGFRSLPKMQCFKEGGAVKSKYCGGGKAYKEGGHAESEEMSEDIAQDKKIIKKAFSMHDKQEHPGEKTDLSKLKKGGRMKKEGGCVGRYKAGGSIKMKKDDADIKDIQKIKLTKVKKAKTPSAPVTETEGSAMPFKKGGCAKKYNTGGGVLDTVKSVGKKLYENVMGTPEQNKAAAEQEKAIAEKDPSSYEAKYRKMTGKKEGGKACQ